MADSWIDSGANSLSYDAPKVPSVSAATAIGHPVSTIGTAPSPTGRAASAVGSLSRTASAVGSLPKPAAPAAAAGVRPAVPAKPAMPAKPAAPRPIPGLSALSTQATPVRPEAGRPIPPPPPPPPPSEPSSAPGINGLESQAPHTAAGAPPSVVGTLFNAGLGALNYTSPASFGWGVAVEALGHGLDRDGSNQIHQSAMQRSYPANAANNLVTAPHVNAGRILDAAATTGYNSAQQGLRQLSLDPQIYANQQQRIRETQQAMAQGRATPQQLRDAQTRLQREIAEQKADNSLRPWLWGI